MSNIELERWSARLATVLRERGVEPGDRVLLQIPNAPEVIASCERSSRASRGPRGAHEARAGRR